MKHSAISGVIRKRFKKIAGLYAAITGGFDMEDIHELRTETKKIRAFFRLLNVELDDNNLKVPPKLKSFYLEVGAIRNLQLQVKNMQAYVADPAYTVSNTYIEYLERMIQKWKERTTGPGVDDVDFDNDEKQILKKIPQKLSNPSLKKFLQKKIREYEALVIELPDDDVLHSIRKLLKDILYNWEFVEKYDALLPGELCGEEKIKVFTELLGLFLDKVIAMNLLETYYKDCEENGLFFEKDTRELKEIETLWNSEKQELAQLIYVKLGLPGLLTPG